ncbi:hypothetical protein BRAS3843_2720006 [Bradyrhizobium sp. STM 3843]|nr:hypothetical protein BRAS3843_2720006 [Bradyrhizobium sp. STM 3843]
MANLTAEVSSSAFQMAKSKSALGSSKRSPDERSDIRGASPEAIHRSADPHIAALMRATLAVSFFKRITSRCVGMSQFRSSLDRHISEELWMELHR